MCRTHAGDVHRFVLFLSGDPALIRDEPVIGIACWVTAAIIWIWHVRIRRRLRVSGL